MPKVYCCKQIVNGETCGESDPAKFIEGRYTTCRVCRSQLQKKYTVKKIDPVKETVKIVTDEILSSILLAKINSLELTVLQMKEEIAMLKKALDT